MRQRLLAAIAVTATLLFAVACVRFSTPQDVDWSTQYGETVIGEGFDSIADRYLEPVAMSELALSGLDGLRALDDSLQFELEERTLRVRRSGEPIGLVRTPVTNNPTSWSSSTVAAIDIARAKSPELHEAKAETIFRAVFEGALAPLDRFSRYADAATATENRALRDGFGGIGVTIRMEDTHALILEVNGEGPASRAEVEANDRVTHIDGVAIAGWTQRQLVDALRGYTGTPVSLTIERKGATLAGPIVLLRDHIVPQTVTLRRDGKMAIIRVSSFNQDTAERLTELVAASLAGPAPPPAGYVLDMRANPGGLLNRAVETVDVFADRGRIVTTQGRHRMSIQSYPASPGDATGGRPLVVLINGNSASAAEVVAAALQDLGRAVIVGTNSFGKGTVQSVIELPNDGELTLTWSRLLAPSGYRLHGLGVLPTLCTHGGGTNLSADRVIDKLRHEAPATTDVFARWRASVNADPPQREALRDVCRADGDAPATDIDVAQALIEDPALYRLALRLADTTVARR